MIPNSIAQAAIFVVVCEGFLGIDPHWDLWTHIFSTELFALTMGEKKVRMGRRGFLNGHCRSGCGNNHGVQRKLL